MLGELTGEDESDRSLDLPAGESSFAVVLAELSGLSGDTLKDVVDKGIHDAHSLLGHTSVGVHLLQHLVDVDREGVTRLASASTTGASLLAAFFGGFL